MKDFLDKEMQVGDKVVALVHSSTSSALYSGKIINFTRLCGKEYVDIKVDNPESDWKLRDVMRVSPYKVVKIKSEVDEND